MCSPLSTSVALNWISCPVCSDVCWVLLFHWRHGRFIGLRHTLKQVAQLWWKCKSLPWRVNPSRARSTDVWRENGKNRSSCKTSAQWLVPLSEFDSFGSITFGKTRRARLNNFIFIKLVESKTRRSPLCLQNWKITYFWIHWTKLNGLSFQLHIHRTDVTVRLIFSSLAHHKVDQPFPKISDPFLFTLCCKCQHPRSHRLVSFIHRTDHSSELCVCIN